MLAHCKRRARYSAKPVMACQDASGRVLHKLVLNTYMQHDALLIVWVSGSAAYTSYTSIDGCWASRNTHALLVYGATRSSRGQTGVLGNPESTVDVIRRQPDLLEILGHAHDLTE